MEFIYTLMPGAIWLVESCTMRVSFSTFNLVENNLDCEFLCSEMTETELYEFIILFKYSLLIGF